jgi:4-hydroxybenzoate polyprenyltransferase
MRPRQWYKNLVVFIPLLFSGNASNTVLWPPILLCFAAFCALSSSVYAANDVLDAERDRLHPRKRDRPIASGRVSPSLGIAVSIALSVAALLALSWLGPLSLALGTGYLLLQVLYNGLLKRLVLWDALAVAIGFVVRALAGSAAIDVPSTEWLVVCTFLFALYLALAKRRHELLLTQDDPRALESRPILGAYSVRFVEEAMQMSATLLLMSYSLYTFFGTDSWMMFTIPFAMYGVFRYSWLVHRRDLGDEAELVFKDRATVINAVLWLATIVAVKAGWPQAAYEWLHALG